MVVVVVVVVVVVRTRCSRDVFVDINARMQLIGVAEPLGVRPPGVPATPSPRQPTTVRRRGLKNEHSRPAGRSAKNGAKCA